jgi:cephalosporin hydroxylase
MVEHWNSFNGTSIGGVRMAQYWCDLYLWELVLNENPQVRRIVELGTWMGGFSLWLHMQAKVRNMDFVTYDSIDFNTVATKIVPFYRKDIFAEYRAIGETISSCPTILFCDNGNKPRELKTFAPYLTQNSIVLVHDWNVEIGPDDVPDYLEELYGDVCDEIGSITRVFRKKVFH